MAKEYYRRFLETWIDSVSLSLDNIRNEIPGNFYNRYSRVLNRGRTQTENISRRLISLEERIDNRSLNYSNQGQLYREYIDSMSFEIELDQPGNKKVFLPCFSDECLKEISLVSFLYLTPFRGLFYSWKLGEIYSLLENGEDISAKEEINTLYRIVKEHYALQRDPSRIQSYRNYLSILDPSIEDEDKNSEIQAVKNSFLKVGMPIKRLWNLVFPYPTYTSTHFYLSGIRFYNNPLLSLSEDELSGLGGSVYYVNSNDSGIFKPIEHYGLLLETNDPDELEEIYSILKPGALGLDVFKNDVTEEDINNLPNFEKWSRILTTKTYHLLSRVLDYYDMDYGSKARAVLMSEVSKNPLRKFYFDSGIFKIAKMLGRISRDGGTPKISYITTRKSSISRKYETEFRIAKNMLSEFIDTKGIEYYYLVDVNGFESVSGFEALDRYTLLPTGQLEQYTSFLLSNRDKASRKISHGLETNAFYYLDAQELKRVVKRNSWEITRLVGTSVAAFINPAELGPLVIEASHFTKKIVQTVTGISRRHEEVVETIRAARRSAIRIGLGDIDRLKNNA